MNSALGKAFVFGDDVTTDALAPGAYMKQPLSVLAQHCMESIAPSFAQEVKAGDYVVGGCNFGMGSSREQAVIALNMLGVSGVIAVSFAGLFFRNCINLGLAPLVCADAVKIAAGDKLSVDLSNGVIENHTQQTRYSCEPIPPALLAMLQSGGLIPHLKKTLSLRK
jgi:3-isopropylmalate/(R)-2-methylmalate dehydratase small subunit